MLGETCSLKFAFTSFSRGLLSARGFFEAGLGYLFAHFTWSKGWLRYSNRYFWADIPVSNRIFQYVKFL